MQSIHLIIEAGPEKGRTLFIPPEGARVGRSSNNDIQLHDASLSRFHCRFYFKEHQHLHVADLASTNETLVNGKSVQDVALNIGDRVTIGETTLKVVATHPEGITFEPTAEAGSGGGSAPAAEAPPAVSAIGGEKPVEGVDIDLGLRPSAVEPERRLQDRSRRLLLYGVGAAILLGVALVAAWLLRVPPTGSRPRAPRTGDAAPALELDYEKIEASNTNIFRYRLTLREGVLSIRIDNLEDGRHLSREKKVDPQVIAELARRLAATDFRRLQPEYAGLQPDILETRDLTIVQDRRAHRVRVVNRIEPPPFRDARVLIEEFGQNELGLFAVALPRERLLEMAREAWLQGRKLFDEREVRNDNLAKAIKRFHEVELLLEAVEPKPELYADAIRAREECARLLQERYEDIMFRADRAIRLREWREANDHLVTVLDMLQDREDERYQRAYKKLLDVQGRLRVR